LGESPKREASKLRTDLGKEEGEKDGLFDPFRSTFTAMERGEKDKKKKVNRKPFKT